MKTLVIILSILVCACKFHSESIHDDDNNDDAGIVLPGRDAGNPADSGRPPPDAAVQPPSIDAGTPPIIIVDASVPSNDAGEPAFVTNTDLLFSNFAVTFNATTGKATATVTYSNLNSALQLFITDLAVAVRYGAPLDPNRDTNAGGPFDRDMVRTTPVTTVLDPLMQGVYAGETQFDPRDRVGTWRAYPTWKDINGTWHDGSPQTFNFVHGTGLTATLNIERYSTTDVSATATLTNNDLTNIVVSRFVIAVRKSGYPNSSTTIADLAEHDLRPERRTVVLLPGQTVTLNASTKFKNEDNAFNPWRAYPTWQGLDGVWHDGVSTEFLVHSLVPNNSDVKINLYNKYPISPNPNNFIARDGVFPKVYVRTTYVNRGFTVINVSAIRLRVIDPLGINRVIFVSPQAVTMFNQMPPEISETFYVDTDMTGTWKYFDELINDVGGLIVTGEREFTITSAGTDVDAGQ